MVFSPPFRATADRRVAAPAPDQDRREQPRPATHDDVTPPPAVIRERVERERRETARETVVERRTEATETIRERTTTTAVVRERPAPPAAIVVLPKPPRQSPTIGSAPRAPSIDVRIGRVEIIARNHARPSPRAVVRPAAHSIDAGFGGPIRGRR